MSVKCNCSNKAKKLIELRKQELIVLKKRKNSKHRGKNITQEYALDELLGIR